MFKHLISFSIILSFSVFLFGFQMLSTNQESIIYDNIESKSISDNSDFSTIRESEINKINSQLNLKIKIKEFEEIEENPLNFVIKFKQDYQNRIHDLCDIIIRLLSKNDKNKLYEN